MNNFLRGILTGILLYLVTPGLFSQESRIIMSPENRVKIDVDFDESVTYCLTFDGEKVLDNSRLGMMFQDVPALGKFRITGETTRNIDETWEYPLGKQTYYTDHCVETAFELQEIDEPNRLLTLVFRAYDDGIAFRYIVPEQPGIPEFCVSSDDTEFSFGQDYDIWAAFYSRFNTSQENFFLPKKLSDIKPDSFVGMPLIVCSDKFVAALTESDLLDWAGGQFAASAENPTTVKIRLTPRRDGRGAVVRQTPAASPWRVILLGKKPVDLINNSGIVMNTATPCQLSDVSWIRPGNSSWDWWAVKSPREISNDIIFRFIDFAEKMGWEYTTFDAGWARRTNYGYDKNDTTQFADGVDIPECVDYASGKNVRLFLWFHWQDLEQAGVSMMLERCAKWGVAGVKIDFLDSDCQEMVQWATETCRIAAENKILVNYHGMYKPTGMNRTLPNQITREGIRGNEYNRWSALTSQHLVSLPFTRCLLGPADFTPGGFLNEHPETFNVLEKTDTKTCHVIGTRARELALCMIYDSPLRTICDLPEFYENQPGIEYLRDLPTVWDETRALDGDIGEFLVMARRSGNRWFLSAITNEQARSVEVALDFLEDGVEYEAAVYADDSESDSDAKAIAVTKENFKKGDMVTLNMVRDGGWNAVFVKKQESVKRNDSLSYNRH